MQYMFPIQKLIQRSGTDLKGIIMYFLHRHTSDSGVTVSSFTISPVAAETDVNEMKMSFQSDPDSAH